MNKHDREYVIKAIEIFSDYIKYEPLQEKVGFAAFLVDQITSDAGEALQILGAATTCILVSSTNRCDVELATDHHIKKLKDSTMKTADSIEMFEKAERKGGIN